MGKFIVKEEEEEEDMSVQFLALLIGVPSSEIICTYTTASLARYVYKMADMGKCHAASTIDAL